MGQLQVVNRLVAGLLLGALLTGCATFGGARHAGTVGLVSVHSVLGAVQDTEMMLVCGRPGAPQAPLCVPVPKHRQISVLLAQAFDLEIRIANVMRSLPAGSPQPAEVIGMMTQINALITKIVEMLPDNQQKEALVQNIGGLQ